MNKDSFIQYIENDRDCDKDLLEEEKKKGLARAKSERFDTRKLLMLAAASVFTLVMCFTVNLRPLKTAVDEYYRNGDTISPGSVEIVEGYIKELADNVKRYLGGE
ncbi:MAG: hypothetical protein LBQ94_01705 [Treponema sp.]|jgi:hypothetical protein|nr:hypothetical protein [Treponema sp.]